MCVLRNKFVSLHDNICFWELIFQNSSVTWCVLRQLQEDEDALYHATGGRPNRVPLQRARPEGPKKATPSVMQFLNMGEVIRRYVGHSLL